MHFLPLHLLSRESILKLKEEYYKPRDLAEDEELENIVDAILKQKAMAMDTGYVADVSFVIVQRVIWVLCRISVVLKVAKHYYRFQNSEQMGLGTDVLALDILRGRDHGLESYTKYLEMCTKTRIQSWTDLGAYINNEVKWKILTDITKIYTSVQTTNFHLFPSE